MTKILRSDTKKSQNEGDSYSNLSITKNSETTQRQAKKAIDAKNENKQQNDIWNINRILSNIFMYTGHKELLEFSTVCKKWNHLINPIIHKNIKLNRSWDIIKNFHDEKLNKLAKIDAEVMECIYNNAKHARLINNLKLNIDLEPQRTIEVFQTFRFISNLTIENCEMSQDQFLCMISPLTQLQELALYNLSIKTIIYKRLYKEVVQLPSTLKKLSLNVKIIDNPDLFIQTINSHTDLIEISYLSSNHVFLEPLYKSYPSLLKFEYSNDQLHSPQLLIKIFEQNSQLTSLNLNLKCWNSELTSYISSHLTNLEEFWLTEYVYYLQNYADIFLKFSHPTKIKKLNLHWTTLSNCSLDSILLNCPHLEELKLNRYNSYQQSYTEIVVNLSKYANLKKLNINCVNLSVDVLESILVKCRHLIELVINLPIEWKEAIKSINENCENLQRLEIFIPNWFYGQVTDNFFGEFYETELFTENLKCKSTLTDLTLNGFKAIDSKAEYFKNIEKLKYIKFPFQTKTLNTEGKEIGIDVDLWPDYKLNSKFIRHHCDIELKRILKN